MRGPTTTATGGGRDADWGQRCARWRGVRSEVAVVDGVRARLLRADGPDGGTPHLLIHGLGGCATDWLEVMPRLARHGPVVAVDLPGFGRTRPAGSTSVDANAEFLTALLDVLDWPAAEVHGNSMGGMLALLLAHRSPRRVVRLVLTAPALPAPRTRLHRTAPATLVRFTPFLVPGLGHAGLRALWRIVDPRREWRELLAYVHADPDAIRPETLEVGLENLCWGRERPWRLRSFATAAESIVRMLVRPRRLLAAVDDVAVPVLVVWGDEDRLIGRSVIDHAVQRRPDWRLAVLRGVGHVPMIEAPDRFVAAVTRWRTETSEAPTLVA